MTADNCGDGMGTYALPDAAGVGDTSLAEKSGDPDVVVVTGGAFDATAAALFIGSGAASLDVDVPLTREGCCRPSETFFNLNALVLDAVVSAGSERPTSDAIGRDATAGRGFSSAF